MARIRTTDLAQLCRRTGSSFRAGIDIRRILEDEARRGPPAQRNQMRNIATRVAGGDSLAEAMRDSGGYFPSLACEMVEIGEQTGRLDQALTRMADHYDHLLKLRRTFMLAIAWPAIELGLAIFVIGLLIWALGIVASVRGGEPVDVLGLGLVGTQGMLIFFALIAMAAAALIIPIAAILQGRVGAKPLETFMRLPILGKTLQTICLARFAWSLSMALEAGMDARRSMRIALRSTQNLYFTSHQKSVDEKIVKGHAFHEALRATGAFPDEFLDALESSELSGTQSEAMERLSEEYQARAVAASKVIATVAAFATWGLVAVIIIVMIFRLFFIFYFQPLQEALDFANGVG